MNELWEQATQTYNLPLTIGLIICCVYWLVSTIGIFDFDTDVDVDVDIDADMDVNSGSSGLFSSILSFVNASEVPLMLILTLINVYMWAIAMLTNHVLNPENISWLALVLFGLNFIISVILTRYTTKPLAPLFVSLQDDTEKALPLVGQTGKVKSRVIDHKYGQVEIPRDKDSPALINCKLSETDQPMVRGEDVLVVKYEESSQRYIVRSLSSHHKEKLNEIKSNPEEQESENLTTNNEQYE